MDLFFKHLDEQVFKQSFWSLQPTAEETGEFAFVTFTVNLCFPPTLQNKNNPLDLIHIMSLWKYSFFNLRQPQPRR